MSNTLIDFIKLTGDEESANLFEVEERTTASWRRAERKPRPETASLIIERTKNHKYGPVTYSGIYGETLIS